MSTLSVLSTGCVLPHSENGWDSGLSAAENRRSPRIWQLAAVAAARALAGAPATPRSLLSATALGALDETRLFLDRVISENLGSPRNFIASVHNSMAGKLAQDLAIAGPNLTLCDGQNSLASAVRASSLLADADLPVLLVAVDESIELLDRLIPYFSEECRRCLTPGWHDGAVALLCDRSGRGPRLSALGPAPRGTQAAEQACADLCAGAVAGGGRLLPLAETCTSFLQPAFVLRQLIAERKPGRYLITSCAPSADTVAALDLCI